MTCFEMKERGKNRKDIIKGELSLLDVQGHQSCCENSVKSDYLVKFFLFLLSNATFTQ